MNDQAQSHVRSIVTLIALVLILALAYYLYTGPLTFLFHPGQTQMTEAEKMQQLNTLKATSTTPMTNQSVTQKQKQLNKLSAPTNTTSTQTDEQKLNQLNTLRAQ